MKNVKINDFSIGDGNPLVFILGPCVIESEEGCYNTALKLKQLSEQEGFSLIFKASYDKANRSSLKSYRGPGIKAGMIILDKIKKELNIPVLTDGHSVIEIEEIAPVADIIQIPALLSRQTDLIAAAAKTGRVVNVKKGQFMAPWDVKNIIEKVPEDTPITITERGSSFGYNNLVVDMKSFPLVRAIGCPVIFDATHSVQLPGGRGTSSGGDRAFISTLARAAAGAGIDGLFMEVHENPEEALCDGPNSLSLSELPRLIDQVRKIDNLIKTTREQGR